MTSKGSWSELPTDLLQIICEKLVDAKDYARFGAICTSWRSVIWQSRYQVPVLMFPNSSEKFTFNPFKTKYTHTYFSITEDLHVPILPVTSDEHLDFCVGSCHGWLLIKKRSNCLDDDMLQLHLWNPFLSVVIKLPSLQGKGIVKFTLSNNPIWKSDYAVMVICSPTNDYWKRLALFKTGDKSWTYIVNHDEHWRSFYNFNDVIFYKDQFYGLCCSELVSCDITPTKPILTRVVSLPRRKYYYSCRLVESSGDLLCVAREVDPAADYFTVGFSIFKFLTNEESSHWIELKNLRGHTLFLGDHYSLSLLSSDFHQCKSNHIYYAYICSVNRKHMHDEGIFNLEDSSRKPLYSENLINKPLYCPIWVQPTLNIAMDSASCKLHMRVFNLENTSLQLPFSENVNEQLTNPVLVQPPTTTDSDVGVFNLEDTNLRPLFSENVHEQLTNPIFNQPRTVNMTMQIPKSASGSTNKRVYHHISKLLNCLGCLSNVQRVVV